MPLGVARRFGLRSSSGRPLEDVRHAGTASQLLPRWRDFGSPSAGHQRPSAASARSLTERNRSFSRSDPPGAAGADATRSRLRLVAADAQAASAASSARQHVGRELGQVVEGGVLEGVGRQPAVGLAGLRMDRRRQHRLRAVQQQLDADHAIAVEPAQPRHLVAAARPGAVVAHPALGPEPAHRRRRHRREHRGRDVPAVGVDVEPDDGAVGDADAGVGPLLPALVQELRRLPRAPFLPARHGDQRPASKWPGTFAPGATGMAW